jgi:hypothetical protein
MAKESGDGLKGQGFPTIERIGGVFSLACQGSYRIEVVYKVGFAWVHCQIEKVFCFWRKDYAS